MIFGIVMICLCCGDDWIIFDIVFFNLLYGLEKFLMECVGDVVFGLVDWIG